MTRTSKTPADVVSWEALHHELDAIKGVVRTDIADMEARVSAQLVTFGIRFDAFTKEITDHARAMDVLTTQLAADGRARETAIASHAKEIECLYAGLDKNKEGLVTVKIESARGDKRAMVVGGIIAAAFTTAGLIAVALIQAQAAGAIP